MGHEQLLYLLVILYLWFELLILDEKDHCVSVAPVRVEITEIGSPLAGAQAPRSLRNNFCPKVA